MNRPADTEPKPAIATAGRPLAPSRDAVVSDPRTSTSIFEDANRVMLSVAGDLERDLPGRKVSAKLRIRT